MLQRPHGDVAGAVVAAVGVLRCWRGGSGAAVAGRDDGGGGCAVALLGRQRRCRDMRAATLNREATINMLLGCVCGKARGWGRAQRPRSPLETASLNPAGAPRRHSLQEWMLSCGGEEEVAAMGVDRMAAMTDDNGVDVVALAATRAGVGRRDDNGGVMSLFGGGWLTTQGEGARGYHVETLEPKGRAAKVGRGGDGDKLLHVMHAKQPLGSAADSAALRPIKGGVARGQGQEGEGTPRREAGRGGGAPAGGGEENGREGEEERPISQGLMADSQQ